MKGAFFLQTSIQEQDWLKNSKDFIFSANFFTLELTTRTRDLRKLFNDTFQPQLMLSIHSIKKISPFLW